MSRFVQQSLISARFIVTFGHLIALLVLFGTIEENVTVGLSEGYSEEDRKEAMYIAWVSEICMMCCMKVSSERERGWCFSTVFLVLPSFHLDTFQFFIMYVNSLQDTFLSHYPFKILWFLYLHHAIHSNRLH